MLILPNSSLWYESPIPDLEKLDEAFWLKRSELVGVNINEKKGLELLEIFGSKYKNEYEAFPMNETSVPYQYYVSNPMFGSIDAEILYCMIRYFKPLKITEIGSGYSTRLSAQAILKNQEEDDSYKCELVAIEPYPQTVLKTGFPGLSELVPKPIQEIPLSTFERLAQNDILFIDSSHVLRTGGDLQYEYLEILPRLSKGVIVQIHDIRIPEDYPKYRLKQNRFYTEQYLLQAFLAFNNAFEVLWPGNYMQLKYPDKLDLAFSRHRQFKGGDSFWMRKIM
ncbi:MAG: class I SAM-dependent methyltransferase [Candidatus Bathyarchaeia archaeon]